MSGYPAALDVRAAVVASEALLRQQADDSYTSDNSKDCIEKYQQLLELATNRGDIWEATDLRFWMGCALHSSGRLIQAAATIAPALGEAEFGGGRILQNRLLTRYLLISVDIPLPIQKIELAFDQVERMLEIWGWENKDSRVPLARGYLALYRGRSREAMRWARIGVSRNPGDPSAYSVQSYVLLFMKSCVLNNRIDLLEDLLAGGVRIDENRFCNTRRIVVNLANAEICRLDGDFDQALDWTRSAEEAAWIIQDSNYRTLALHSRVKALLAAGNTAKARPIISYLVRGRHTEITHNGFESRMLLGEYHLCEAKRQKIRGTSATVAMHRDSSLRAYDAARRVGIAIDFRLRCHWKRNQANTKLKEVKEI